MGFRSGNPDRRPESFRWFVDKHRNATRPVYLVLQDGTGRQLVSPINVEMFRPDELEQFVGRLLALIHAKEEV